MFPSPAPALSLRRRRRCSRGLAVVLATALAGAVGVVATLAPAAPAGAAPRRPAVAPAPPTSEDGGSGPRPGSAVVSLRPEEGEVTRLYRAALGRAPEMGGFHYWVARRLEGVPLDVVAESFLDSREYQLRFGLDDEAGFVDRVYDNVLGRAGDAAGLAYWRAELARGLSRRHLVLLFSESQELRNLTGTDPPVLPPFQWRAEAVDAADLGSSWRPGCPVDPGELRALHLTHVGYDGLVGQGTLVVHQAVVDDVAAVFGRLYQARFPLASVRPVSEFDGDDGRSMAADNTSAFNCREVTGGGRWSAHAYGTAIDINPVVNPYVARVVLPPAGVDHLDRTAYHPGMIRPGDVVVRAFAEIGWRWGGRFRSLTDYQHLEA